MEDKTASIIIATVAMLIMVFTPVAAFYILVMFFKSLFKKYYEKDKS